MSKKAPLPRAACVFVLRNGKVLSVSRKHDPSVVGMPGGKVDEGETDAQAAARECFEETGMIVGGLKLLYEGEDGFGYWCSTFTVERAAGEPRDMGQGHVEWITPDSLLQGHFAEYNGRVLSAWRKQAWGV